MNKDGWVHLHISGQFLKAPSKTIIFCLFTRPRVYCAVLLGSFLNHYIPVENAWYLQLRFCWACIILFQHRIYQNQIRMGLLFLAHLSWKLKWAFLITCHPSSVCLSVCKLFTFSSSSPEPLGQFQTNLAQSILGWRGFQFVQMKGPALFQGEIITK